MPCSHTCITSWVINVQTIINLSMNGTFVTTDGHTLTHCTCPKSIVCIITTFGIVQSMGFDKCRMRCIHHDGILYFYCLDRSGSNS